MGICCRCGYLTDDGDMAKGIQPEVHECNDAHVLIGKKAREEAQAKLIADGVLEDKAGVISVKK